MAGHNHLNIFSFFRIDAFCLFLCFPSDAVFPLLKNVRKDESSKEIAEKDFFLLFFCCIVPKKWSIEIWIAPFFFLIHGPPMFGYFRQQIKDIDQIFKHFKTWKMYL